MKQFIEYIDKSVVKLEKEEKDLITSERKDESNLVKIKLNIYGVCKTIFEVVSKTSGQNDRKDVYLTKLDNLSQSWKTSYEKANQHQDVTKLVIEEIKLQTLEEIRNKFLETRED